MVVVIVCDQMWGPLQWICALQDSEVHWMLCFVFRLYFMLVGLLHDVLTCALYYTFVSFGNNAPGYDVCIHADY